MVKVEFIELSMVVPLGKREEGMLPVVTTTKKSSQTLSIQMSSTLWILG
jgi:hypothetical protein